MWALSVIALSFLFILCIPIFEGLTIAWYKVWLHKRILSGFGQIVFLMWHHQWLMWLTVGIEPVSTRFNHDHWVTAASRSSAIWNV